MLRFMKIATGRFHDRNDWVVALWDNTEWSLAKDRSGRVLTFSDTPEDQHRMVAFMDYAAEMYSVVRGVREHDAPAVH